MSNSGTAHTPDLTAAEKRDREVALESSDDVAVKGGSMGVRMSSMAHFRIRGCATPGELKGISDVPPGGSSIAPRLAIDPYNTRIKLIDQSRLLTRHQSTKSTNCHVLQAPW